MIFGGGGGGDGLLFRGELRTDAGGEGSMHSDRHEYTKHAQKNVVDTYATAVTGAPTTELEEQR